MQSQPIARHARDQARLISALATRLSTGRGKNAARLIETHISYVLLTGANAYKIKKAVDFGFLDFTTLSARKRFCDQEIRLNRRLAPQIYLEVVPIAGSTEEPEIGGRGPVLEYAVRMREFPQDSLAGELLARNALSAGDIEALASEVAAFHSSIEVAPRNSNFGTPEAVLGTALENFSTIRAHSNTPAEQEDVDALAAWTEREYASRQAIFRDRKEGGFVRECHGDLHLGNIARVDGKLTIFDCIEFNDSMRWIDVMSEIAFTIMDLEDRKRPDLARRFLNAYLEATGDYAGLAVLRFYLAYRALVRAKIHRLRAAQLAVGSAQARALAESRGYRDLARSYTRTRRGAIVVTCGASGCGKTALTRALLEWAPAVRIRSDIERKRLHGLSPLERAPRRIEAGLYASASTEVTYRRARALTRDVVSAGFIAIVDAAFLRRWQRDLLRTLAAHLRVPFVILAFTAHESTLRDRIARRMADANDASDADLAVLEHQLSTREPLGADEMADVVEYDADAPLERAHTAKTWESIFERIQ